MSKAAVAAGADALLLEVHPDPDNAVSDGRQSMDMETFAKLMHDLKRIAAAIDRYIGDAPNTFQESQQALIAAD
jgi:3-deoxy-7-phosphoheptulonate synthase